VRSDRVAREYVTGRVLEIEAYHRARVQRREDAFLRVTQLEQLAQRSPSALRSRTSRPITTRIATTTATSVR